MPPNPNFLSRATRGSLGLPFAPFVRFEGRSASASSTATSKSSSSPAPPSRAPFRSAHYKARLSQECFSHRIETGNEGRGREDRRRRRRKLTAFEAFEALLDGLLVLLALLDLFELHLLAELLALALLALLLGALHACTLVKQALADALHMRVALDHLGEVIRGAGEGEVGFLGERARGLCAVQRLLVTVHVRCKEGLVGEGKA